MASSYTTTADVTDGAEARYGRDGKLLSAATATIYFGLRFHDLRHSHRTWLTELGIPEVLQDDRLGHRPPGMRGIYTHVTATMRRQVAARLEQVWDALPVAARGSWDRGPQEPAGMIPGADEARHSGTVLGAGRQSPDVSCYHACRHGQPVRARRLALPRHRSRG